MYKNRNINRMAAGKRKSRNFRKQKVEGTKVMRKRRKGSQKNKYRKIKIERRYLETQRYME